MRSCADLDAGVHGADFNDPRRIMSAIALIPKKWKQSPWTDGAATVQHKRSGAALCGCCGGSGLVCDCTNASLWGSAPALRPLGVGPGLGPDTQPGSGPLQVKVLRQEPADTENAPTVTHKHLTILH